LTEIVRIFVCKPPACCSVIQKYPKTFYKYVKEFAGCAAMNVPNINMTTARDVQNLAAGVQMPVARDVSDPGVNAKAAVNPGL
jgi:hypothetical protein